MEVLPFEVVARVFDLLRLKEKIKLRCICRSWQAMVDSHLEEVRCIKCHRDLVCRFGCRPKRFEVCPDVVHPETFLKVLALCPAVEQLCLIPNTVNAFRAPPGSGDCGAAAWKQIISTQLGDRVRCLTWDGLDLDKPIYAPALKHLSCCRIPGKALAPVIQVT